MSNRPPTIPTYIRACTSFGRRRGHQSDLPPDRGSNTLLFVLSLLYFIRGGCGALLDNKAVSTPNFNVVVVIFFVFTYPLVSLVVSYFFRRLLLLCRCSSVSALSVLWLRSLHSPERSSLVFALIPSSSSSTCPDEARYTWSWKILIIWITDLSHRVNINKRTAQLSLEMTTNASETSNICELQEIYKSWKQLAKWTENYDAAGPEKLRATRSRKHHQLKPEDKFSESHPPATHMWNRCWRSFELHMYLKNSPLLSVGRFCIEIKRNRLFRGALFNLSDFEQV